MNNNMLKFIEIINSYTIPKIGELSINEKALAEYEKFCLDLIKENQQLKDELEEYKNPIKYWKYANKNVVEKNQQLKEKLERINNYLDKNYTMENQFWFDHIQDIVKDR